MRQNAAARRGADAPLHATARRDRGGRAPRRLFVTPRRARSRASRSDIYGLVYVHVYWFSLFV